MREVSCHLFATVPSVFGPDPTPQIRDIGIMLTQALTDSNLKVRVAGFRALSAFLVHNATNTSIQHALKDLAQPALMVRTTFPPFLFTYIQWAHLMASFALLFV